MPTMRPAVVDLGLQRQIPTHRHDITPHSVQCLIIITVVLNLPLLPCSGHTRSAGYHSISPPPLPRSPPLLLPAFLFPPPLAPLLPPVPVRRRHGLDLALAGPLHPPLAHPLAHRQQVPRVLGG